MLDGGMMMMTRTVDEEMRRKKGKRLHDEEQ